MKKIHFSFFLIFFSGILFSQQEKYSRVKIFTDDLGLKKLAQSGVTIDHGNYRKNVFFESDFSETEIQKIKSSGIKYEIKIDDVSQFYQIQNHSEQRIANNKQQATNCQLPTTYQQPTNFALGAQGGYFTYNEFLANIDSMSAKYPNLISSKAPIDTFHSIQGREIYWLKISDNPNVNEAEPEVMYTSLHHAREPGSLSQLIFYMWYLLENYGTNQEVTNLVDNTEMYFVPMVNPDGYVYNQTTNPNGGGMWRKNRRNNGGGTFGVDLNRNYGYKWGLDDTGSSPDSNSDTYRGDSAFSEPETQAMKFFCENHDFKIVLNYHTYGNLFIYPWGYDYSIYTPDSALFVNYAQLMTRDNNYNFGTGDQTVGYITNGDSDDWMYGEQNSKPKIFSCTPEVGPADNGFWPPSNTIVDLCQANMTQNLTMAHLVGKYATVKEISPSVVSNKNGFFPFKIQRLGLDSPATFTVSITPIGNEITNVGANKIFSSLNLLEEQTDSISYSLGTAIQSGQIFSFALSVDNGSYVSTDTITKIFGQPTTAFSDAGNNLNNWQTTDWGTSSTIFYSASSSITDSPGGDYSNNNTTEITLQTQIDLTNSVDALLTFYARWEIEPGYDYVQVFASSDNGSSWNPLCGKYTHPGNSNQDEGQPLYDGSQLSWIFEEISLKDFAGQNLLLKFQLVSDNWTTGDGFYFDDLKVEKILAPQEIGIDSLVLVPVNPTENDTVQVVVYSTFPSSGCDQTDLQFAINNFSIIASATHSLGVLTVLCGSVDTLTLGQLNSGNYELIYSASDSATSSVFDTDTLNFTVQQTAVIEKVNESFQFDIYPNPNEGNFNLKISHPIAIGFENFKMEFFNILGKKVFSRQLKTGNEQLTPNLSEGIYFCQILSENFRSEVKIIAVVKNK